MVHDFGKRKGERRETKGGSDGSALKKRVIKRRASRCDELKKFPRE